MERLIPILGMLLMFATAASATDTRIKIAIVGDSTVQDYAQTDLHRGWGQMIPSDFDLSRVNIVNFAAGGRSTKTFRSEKRWDAVIAWRPQYIYIQFGHNDSHAKDKPESTDPNTDFSDNLRFYVDDARHHGAVPILVTPMHRGQFDKQGQPTTELQPYADAMKRVAIEKQVPLIDLYTLSGNLYAQKGNAGIADLFAYPDDDRTHFNAKGAQIMADFVAEATKIDVPGLKPYVMR